MPVKSDILSDLSVAECENLGGYLNRGAVCTFDTLTHHVEPSYMVDNGDPTWIPKEALEHFATANFSKDFHKIAQTKLNAMGVVPVDGDVYLPEENLGSRRGQYGQLFRYKKVLFVPIFYDDGEKLGGKSVKLRPIAVDVTVRVPLNAHLR